MPSKSRHPRGKHPHQSKKSKAIQRQEALISQPSSPDKPAQVKKAVVLSAPQPTETQPRQRTISYPYIYRELRRIGVLAVIMFIILIILAVVIS